MDQEDLSLGELIARANALEWVLKETGNAFTVHFWWAGSLWWLG